ncbi:hypothetical protein FRB99_002711 [Tulasnella sp. 403]|nr:hypothetical protein FRB99_002711 [Tulasnella sp. 403]
MSSSPPTTPESASTQGFTSSSSGSLSPGTPTTSTSVSSPTSPPVSTKRRGLRTLLRSLSTFSLRNRPKSGGTNADERDVVVPHSDKTSDDAPRYTLDSPMEISNTFGGTGLSDVHIESPEILWESWETVEVAANVDGGQEAAAEITTRGEDVHPDISSLVRSPHAAPSGGVAQHQSPTFRTAMYAERRGWRASIHIFSR